MTRTGSHLPFAQIRIGEPDANAEFFAAVRTDSSPIFLDCFFPVPNFPLPQFLSGEKYMIVGQKGTGKTSILRYLQAQADIKDAQSEFLIFKKALLEEVDLQQFARLPLMLDEPTLAKFKHYHHTVKRLLVLIMLSKVMGPLGEEELDQVGDGETKSLLKKLTTSSVADVIRLGLDSVGSIFQSVGLDIEKLTQGKALLDGAKLVKRSNDDLLNFFIRRIKHTRRRVRLFIDEIHFAYRSEESLQQDAMLVRDTILAVQSLNERFAEEGVGALIYLAVRAEYMEHPIIATADINHAVESVGHELTWASFPQNRSHPLFGLMHLRFKNAIGDNFRIEQFFKIYLPNIDPQLFLSRTWSKPRDLVRYFKCAKDLYPNRASLSEAESNAVWRVYSQLSWREILSSASPFLQPSALSRFEQVMAALAPAIFDGSAKYNVTTFGDQLKAVHDIAKRDQANFYDFNHFMRLLYILGIFQTKRRDALDQDIFHGYHRGNRNFHADGEVLIHPAVLKAFG